MSSIIEDKSPQTKFAIDRNIELLIEKTDQISESIKDTLKARKWITIGDLRTIVAFQQDGQKNIYKLLANLEFYRSPVKPKPQSKEFIEKMKRLRILEEERQYQELINTERSTIYDKTLSIHQNTRLKLDDTEDEVLNPSQFNKQVKEQLTTIVNILVTGGSVAFAIWYWTDTSMGQGVKISTRVFLSLIFGLFVIVAEVVVYNGYLRRMDEAKQKERKKKEVKKIVETITIKKENKRNGNEVQETKKDL